MHSSSLVFVELIRHSLCVHVRVKCDLIFYYLLLFIYLYFESSKMPVILHF